jgi:hypothetical protein
MVVLESSPLTHPSGQIKSNKKINTGFTIQVKRRLPQKAFLLPLAKAAVFPCLLESIFLYCL